MSSFYWCNITQCDTKTSAISPDLAQGLAKLILQILKFKNFLGDEVAACQSG